jgi:FAD dependent oxidoreductase
MTEVDVLVVGGGTGGTAAAIQAARRGAKTMIVSEFPWLGGMLTAAGVSAPDGNELEAWQTGLWGEFLRTLQQRLPRGGLDNCWVSFFSYDPRLGAQIFAEWVQELPNLQWIIGVPLEVLREGTSLIGVRFAQMTVKAKVILDATELGDLLAMAEVPLRWGWELQTEWGEPSAPTTNTLAEKYPVQAPTWVALMQDFGTEVAPLITRATNDDPTKFAGAIDGYDPQQFLNYGRLPSGLLMLNWPQCGNDYGEGLGRLVASSAERQQLLLECHWHTQNFARFIQSQFGRRYGLANGIFPHADSAFALHPYYRESRRLIGVTTIREQDILPQTGGRVASLQVDAIALGNYVNDHHYPGVQFPLQPKSIRWGGRWTGTPFTIPYRCLIPATTDGLLVCEKNISVSHIANGATRLQPVVMGIGQAAGMAAALCVERNCQPRDLPVRILQLALLQDSRAASALIPLFNLPPRHPDWLYWQQYYLDHPNSYPADGNLVQRPHHYYIPTHSLHTFTGIFIIIGIQNYSFKMTEPTELQGQHWIIVTRRAHVEQKLSLLTHQQSLTVSGSLNHALQNLIIEEIYRSE